MSITGKNCLVAYRNKKINRFDDVKRIITEFSGGGFYFDKIDFSAYNSPQDIVRSLNTSKNNYENIVIVCPQMMKKTLTDYVERLYSSEFDEFFVLRCETHHVFLMFSDAANGLTTKNIINILNKKYGVKYEKSYIKTVGASPEAVESAISEAKAICPAVDFNVYEEYGDCTMELVYGGDTQKAAFDEAYRTVLKKLSASVYALEDVTLAERLVELLKLRRMKISVAESFTGGGVCKRLVDVSGVSEVFYEGLNTYSNEAKHARLGVSEETLKTHGAVSDKTAYEMAQGLLATGCCDVCVATTGIAGPKSDYTRKPVGLAYISVGTADGINVYKFNFKGNRESITKTAINFALFLVYKTVK